MWGALMSGLLFVCLALLSRLLLRPSDRDRVLTRVEAVETVVPLQEASGASVDSEVMDGTVLRSEVLLRGQREAEKQLSGDPRIASEAQAIRHAMEHVPESLRSWSVLQEKSLRTPEEQLEFESSTVQHLGPALAFLSKEAEPVAGRDLLNDIRAEAARIWNVEVVSQALKLRGLGLSDLQLVDSFLMDCAADLVGRSRQVSGVGSQLHGSSPAEPSDRLVDCASVAHAYARSRPAEWATLRRDGSQGFAALARTAEAYGRIE
jgi:hypothetical protein